MTILRHKDYQGSVLFEDGLLVIQILHIDDVITATCESASSAQGVFEELVDDYLETCKELGRDPNRPFRGSFNVRMDPALHKRAAFAASEAGETLNAWVVGAVQIRLDESEARKRFLKNEVALSLLQFENAEFDFHPAKAGVSPHSRSEGVRIVKSYMPSPGERHNQH